MLDQIVATWHALPYAGPAIITGLAAALASWRIGRRRSRTDRLGLAVLVFWGIVTAVTASTPFTGAWNWDATIQPCRFTPWMPLSPTRWAETSSDALNIWYFVPAAFAATLLDGPRRAWAAAAVLATPLICETVQHFLPAAGRVCIAEDVANNWAGTAVGLALGLITTYAVRFVARRPAH